MRRCTIARVRAYRGQQYSGACLSAEPTCKDELYVAGRVDVVWHGSGRVVCCTASCMFGRSWSTWQRGTSLCSTLYSVRLLRLTSRRADSRAVEIFGMAALCRFGTMPLHCAAPWRHAAMRRFGGILHCSWMRRSAPSLEPLVRRYDIAVLSIIYYICYIICIILYDIILCYHRGAIFDVMPCAASRSVIRSLVL